MGNPILPQEIMLLLCQELGARHDFTTLYRCSFISRNVASIALEQLYRTVDAVDLHIEAEPHRSIRLWKSIISSSLGNTLYPYCTYIHALSLSSLADCLQELQSDRFVAQSFFRGSMERFLVLRDQPRSIRSKRFPLDIPAITLKCAESITEFMGAFADKHKTAVALTHLEAPSVPTATFKGWIERLRGLKSLKLRDGSALNAAVGTAISQWCPGFAELTCFQCMSRSMVQFLRALRQDSLQRFEIFNCNSFDTENLLGLGRQSNSLRVLHLRGLSSTAIRDLHLLSGCTALESIIIEKETAFGSEPGDFSPEALESVVEWISSCKALRELTFNHVGDALPVLREVLRAPDIHLEQLAVQDWQMTDPEVAKETWNALGQQSQLKFLTIGTQGSVPDELTLDQHLKLTDSICRLSKLTTLNLMQAWLSTTEICRIAKALPNLEEFSFGGDLVDAAILGPLSVLRNLSLLSINAITAFKFSEIRKFARNLDPITNHGIQFDLLNQWHEDKLTDKHEAELTQYFAEHFQGRFTIGYPNDPDELHEGDFDSDSD